MRLARGLFIVAEGGDGAGKSSALACIAAMLQDSRYEVVMTREPGGTPEGIALRSLLLSNDGPAWDPAAEHLLMAAARAQHVRHVIRPAVEEGAIVLCDRFVGSTIAYQGAGRGLSEEFIRLVHSRTTGDMWPDLTLVFDIDPAVGIARSRRRLDDGSVNEGRFEDLDLAFHERVRRSFLDQAAAAPGRHVVIDAARPQDEVAGQAVDSVRALLNRQA